MTADAVDSLIQAASEAANAGRWHEAETSWQKVLDFDPKHAQALCNLGVHALHRGDNQSAKTLLAKGRLSAPEDLVILMALSNACRLLDEQDAEREAIDAALSVDPYFLPAHLARADWMERFSETSAAAAAYRHTLGLSPPEEQWPAHYRPQLQHAKEFVSSYTTALEKHLESQLAEVRSTLSPDLIRRWREAAAIRAGQSKPFPACGNQLHIPRLPSIPFFDRLEFPFLRNLEAQTEKITAEFLSMLNNHRDKFSPYIKYNAGDPINQWKELDHSDRWSALHLWTNGIGVEENLRKCPETARALETIQLADISGLCPNVLFSVLAPHTHIPPHGGETNARLVAHLPLIVPDDCSFRVGFESREWSVGECLIFDDTIEHEARNDSDDLRAVLIFDLWNPLLTPTEQELASSLAKATREFSPSNTPHARDYL